MEVYERAREAAYRALLESGADALPLDIVKLCVDRGISIYKNSAVSESGARLRGGEAAAIFFDGKSWFMVYDDSISSMEHKRYLLAHEAGREAMRHDILAGYKQGPGGSNVPRILPERPYRFMYVPQEEKEAEAFARHLLAPLPVLRALGITNSADIARLCEIPIEAAEAQAEILEYYSQGAVPLGELERLILERFAAYIEENNPATGVK